MQFKKTWQRLLLALPLLALPALSFAAPVYKLSTFVDMKPGSAFANKYCGSNPCAVEGSTKDALGNLYLAMASPKGKIFKVTPSGQVSVYATFPVSDPSPDSIFNSVNLRLTFDLEGNLYAPFIDLSNYATKETTAMNGVWKIPPGGGNCNLNSGPCKKIWPNGPTTPVVRFLDGVAVDNKGSLYVADAQMGNIWKVNIVKKTGKLWAGVDANNGTANLGGSPVDIALGSPEGRGLGVTGITLDTLGTALYAVNFDRGQALRIPIKADGSAGPQKILLDLSSQDRQMDAVFFDKITQNLYVTIDQTGFMAFNQSLLACIINGTIGTPACTLAPFFDGHQVLSANLIKFQLGLENNVNLAVIIDDPRIGVTTGVNAAGPAIIGNLLGSLYIDVYSSTDGTGPKVMKADLISP